MTTLQLANLLGVQHELVRDAAGAMPRGEGKTLNYNQAMIIRITLVRWGKLAPANYDNTK